MIGNQHANSRLRQTPDGFLQVLYRQRVDSRKRFVEKYKRRLQRKRSRDLQPAALSAGERVSLAGPHRFEPHLHQELLQAVALLFRGQWQGFQHREKILFAGQLAKNRGFLRKVADSAAGPEVHREVRDFVFVQEYTSGVGPGKANKDVKRRCLACAVGSEQPNDFTLSNLQFNNINELATEER